MIITWGKFYQIPQSCITNISLNNAYTKFHLNPLRSNEYAACMHSTWWRHQMEIFSALLAFCAGNSPVTGEFPHKGQWRGVLAFSFICASTNSCVNNGDADDLRRHRSDYDVTVMSGSRQSGGLYDSDSKCHMPNSELKTSICVLSKTHIHGMCYTSTILLTWLQYTNTLIHEKIWYIVFYILSIYFEDVNRINCHRAFS